MQGKVADPDGSALSEVVVACTNARGIVAGNWRTLVKEMGPPYAGRLQRRVRPVLT